MRLISLASERFIYLYVYLFQIPSLATFETIKNSKLKSKRRESRKKEKEIVLTTFEDHINVLRQPRAEDERALFFLFLSLSLYGYVYSKVLSDDTKSSD